MALCREGVCVCVCVIKQVWHYTLYRWGRDYIAGIVKFKTMSAETPIALLQYQTAIGCTRQDLHTFNSQL
jgi:hypothetical protein